MTNRERFVAAMAMLSGVFNRQLSDEAVEGYWLVLKAVPMDDLARATMKALAECRFMPTPAELLEFSGRGGPRALAAEVAVAWGAVRAAMDRHDYTTSVDFGPLVNAVVHNLGGWVQLCAASIPELEWRRKKFEEVYAAFKAKPIGELPSSTFCRGSFGGAPVSIAIGGVLPPKMIAEKSNGVPEVVRQLADAKAIGRNP